MECREVNLEARPLAEEGEDDKIAMCKLDAAEGGQMVAYELEAAEALAGLARCGSLRGDGSGSGELERQLVTEEVGSSICRSQWCGWGTDLLCNNKISVVNPVKLQSGSINCHFHDYASTRITSPEKIEKIVENIPSQLCNTSFQSNSMGKSRHKLTEAAKEARKLRRILANRESARQTIRRRQAMHLELTRKAADVLEENGNLKKEKELAVKEYNSLKHTNEFLKAQLAKIKMPEQGETQEEPMTSPAEKPCPATTKNPIFLHNQPSVVPCLWPSLLASSKVFQFQCASGSNVTSSSQFPIPHEGVPSSRQGQENSMDITRPGTPFFVVTVPWLLPYLTHSSTPDAHSGSRGRRKAHPGLPHEVFNQWSSNQNMVTEASNSTKTLSMGSVHGVGFTFPPVTGGQCTTNNPIDNVVVPGMFDLVRPLEGLRPARNSQLDDSSDAHVVSASEGTRLGLLHKNQDANICLPKKAEDSSTATEARRRRKELMKLKNVHCHHVHLRY